MDIKGRIAKPALSIQLIGKRRFYLGLLLGAGLWVIAYLLLLMGMTTVFYHMMDLPDPLLVEVTNEQLFKARIAFALLGGLAGSALCSLVWFYRPAIRLQNRFITFIRVQHMLWAFPIMYIMVYLVLMVRSSIMLLVPFCGMHMFYHFNPFNYSVIWFLLPFVYLYLYQWMLMQRYFSKIGLFRLGHVLVLTLVSLVLTQFMPGNIRLAEETFYKVYPYYTNNYKLPEARFAVRPEKRSRYTKLILRPPTVDPWQVIVDYKKQYPLDDELHVHLKAVYDSLVADRPYIEESKRFYWHLIVDEDVPMYRLSQLVEQIKRRDPYGESIIHFRTANSTDGHLYYWGYWGRFRNSTFVYPPKDSTGKFLVPQTYIMPLSIKNHLTISGHGKTYTDDGTLVTREYLKDEAVRKLITNYDNWLIFYESDSTATYGDYIRFVEDYYAAYAYINDSVLVPAGENRKMKKIISMDFLLPEEVDTLWHWTDSLQAE